jgi:hypothetical protein
METNRGRLMWVKDILQAIRRAIRASGKTRNQLSKEAGIGQSHRFRSGAGSSLCLSGSRPRFRRRSFLLTEVDLAVTF